MGDGPEAMELDEAAIVRDQARRIQARAGFFGLAVMLGAWLLL